MGASAFVVECTDEREAAMAATRVIVAEDGSCDHSAILDLTSKAGLSVVGEAGGWPDAAELASSKTPDAILVFVDQDPSFVEGVSTLEGSRPVVVACRTLSADFAERAASAGAGAVIPLDATADELRSAVLVVLARGRDLDRVRTEASALRDQLETRKVVERAKGILMKRLGLSEEDAFKRLQRASQDENRKMREIAEAVVRTEKLFGATGLTQPDRAAADREPERERPSYVRHTR